VHRRGAPYGDPGPGRWTCEIVVGYGQDLLVGGIAHPFGEVPWPRWWWEPAVAASCRWKTAKRSVACVVYDGSRTGWSDPSAEDHYVQGTRLRA
jgi:hypothetical protein